MDRQAHLDNLRALRRRTNDPSHLATLDWAIGRIVTAMAASPMGEEGGGGTKPQPRPITQSRRDWMANYMRDYRAGKRRR